MLVLHERQMNAIYQKLKQNKFKKWRVCENKTVRNSLISCRVHLNFVIWFQKHPLSNGSRQ